MSDEERPSWVRKAMADLEKAGRLAGSFAKKALGLNPEIVPGSIRGYTMGNGVDWISAFQVKRCPNCGKETWFRAITNNPNEGLRSAVGRQGPGGFERFSERDYPDPPHLFGCVTPGCSQVTSVYVELEPGQIEYSPLREPDPEKPLSPQEVAEKQTNSATLRQRFGIGRQPCNICQLEKDGFQVVSDEARRLYSTEGTSLNEIAKFLSSRTGRKIYSKSVGHHAKHRFGH